MNRLRLTKQYFPFFLYGLLSGVLIVLSFPFYSYWITTFFSLVPFFLGIFKAQKAKHAAIVGIATMMSMVLLGFPWVSYVAVNFGQLPWFIGVLVLFVFSLFGEIQFLAFALVSFFVLKRLNPPFKIKQTCTLFLGLPVTYLALDFLNPKIFPNTLGHVLYNWTEVAQIAEWTGVIGLSFPVLLTNLSIALFLWFWKQKKPKTSLVPSIFLIFTVACLTGAHFWGAKRIEQIRNLENSSLFSKRLRFSIIQGNIGDLEKLSSEAGIEWAVNKVLKTYKDLSLETVARHKPDLVIWPETAYPMLYTHLEDLIANRSGAARDQWLLNLVQELKTPLFFGGYSNFHNRDFNSAFLVEPPYSLKGLYRKSILLAFGEYIPLGPLGPLVQKYVPNIANFGRGQGPMVFEFNKIKIGPQICYEGIVPEHSRGAVKLGADVLLNITNDSWFGNTSEPYLHLLLTAFRSIETRRPMIRATNTGITTIIDRVGQMHYQTDLMKEAIVEAEIFFPNTETQPKELDTFYLNYGDVFGVFCVISALVFHLFFFLIKSPLIKTRK